MNYKLTVISHVRPCVFFGNYILFFFLYTTKTLACFTKDVYMHFLDQRPWPCLYWKQIR